METKLSKLLDRAECMTLVSSQACSYWSYIRFLFSIPLILTSSAMCIINSISTDANSVRIPNIVVNGVSVLIVSLSNNIKAGEKCDMYRKLSQSFMNLSQEVETYDAENVITKEKYEILTIKYDNLIADCAFEDIPTRYKRAAAISFTANGRQVPIQLNGTINCHYPKKPALIMEPI